MLPEPTLFDATKNRDEVYREIQGHLSEARAQVLLALWELHTATDDEIRQKLGWEINRITGRRSELQDLGLVKSCGEEKGPYNHPRTIWMIDQIQLNYFITQQKGLQS